MDGQPLTLTKQRHLANEYTCTHVRTSRHPHHRQTTQPVLHQELRIHGRPDSVQRRPAWLHLHGKLQYNRRKPGTPTPTDPLPVRASATAQPRSDAQRLPVRRMIHRQHRLQLQHTRHRKHHARRSLDQQNPRNSWTISPNKGSQPGDETTTIAPPYSRSGVKLNQISSSIGSGKMHNSVSLAVGSDGNTYAWGHNTSGQLGNGTRSGFNGANPVPGCVCDPNNPEDTSKSLKSVQISAGFEHSMAIDAQGNTWSWGWNYWGELGQNTTNDDILRPARTYNPDNPTIPFKASQVSAGYDTSLAVDSNGISWSWGRNDYGQLGYTNYDSSTVHRQPAKVRNPASPNNTDLSLNSTLVSAGNRVSLAIGKDGYTYAWGIQRLQRCLCPGVSGVQPVSGDQRSQVRH